MKLTCPHCSQPLELDAETHAALQGQPHFECPECGGAIAVPVLAPARPATPQARMSPGTSQVAGAAVKAQLGMQRNLRWLGIAALLVLGGVGAFLALRGGNVFNTTQNVRQIINNQFFQNLITTGKATRQALEEMAAIQADGEDFVGVSREKLTWTQAQDLARRAGAEVLPIEPQGNDLRPPRLERLTQLFPDLHGLTSWVRDEDLPTLLDSPDLARATTPERARPALFQWHALPEDKRAWVKIVSTNPPSPHVFKTGEFVTAKVDYNNPGANAVNISIEGRKGNIITSYLYRTTPPAPTGQGSQDLGFSLRNDDKVDVIRVKMTDSSTRKLLYVTSLPVDFEWKRDLSAYEIELTAVKAPAVLLPSKDIRIQAKAGQKFKLDLTVRYKTPSSTKLAANLDVEKANILPPELLAELNKDYSMTRHFDTGSRPGYQAVVGAGEITFDLTGYAPPKPGTYSIPMNIGLYDFISWSTILRPENTVTLEVAP
ncbi:MAG: hypothetical protein IAE77_05320 [Prosthecobacter sp.]|jgi:hypothetical protein|uniref:hypothetical protein n=1 Tax=Prosthecobacter sp. TaxID=1965333 RepID=UPI0019F2E1E4|nr:hypothetical protein [Prosthecobacter sp.]MBE2282863.1 hypothetical protein [Prosthecobacter sp.]